MTPKITFRVSKDNLKIRIKIHGLEPGLYDTGIFCPADKFDSHKQISGYPAVQNYMDSAKESIRKIFMPGMSPENLWNEFVKQRGEALQTHTVEDAFKYYSRTKNVRKATLDNKVSLLDSLAKHGFDKKLIRDMNGAAQREFFSKLNLSESSLHAISVRLNTVLGYYIQEHSLGIELPKGLIKPAKAKETEEDEYLTWAELQKLLNTTLESEELKYPAKYTDQHYLDFWCFMALTGMAISDALKFDPKKHVKDDKWIKYKRHKTNSECIIPLLIPTRRIIEKYSWPFKASVRIVQSKCEGFISELVGRKIKTHGARKTAGCVFLELGFTMEAVSKMLGHSSITTTESHYAKITQAKIERERNDIPKAVQELMGV